MTVSECVAGWLGAKDDAGLSGRRRQMSRCEGWYRIIRKMEADDNPIALPASSSCTVTSTPGTVVRPLPGLFLSKILCSWFTLIVEESFCRQLVPAILY